MRYKSDAPIFDPMKAALYMFLLAALLLFASAAFAAEAILPLPRFASLASDETNVRVGPGQRYPIRFVLKKEGLPVEIIREHDTWRQIRLQDGDEGWVHKSLLSGKRAVIVASEKPETLRRKPDAQSMPVVKLEKGVVAEVSRCDANWCRLSSAGYTGWAERAHLWGVYAQETIGKD